MTTTPIPKLVLDYEIFAQQNINLIASENYPSHAVAKTLGSLLSGKYAEGYPGSRYYSGMAIIDKIENETKKLARSIFNTNYYVNVQAYSGAIANFAIEKGLLEIGDTILSLGLNDGGHLSHGSPVSYTSKEFKIINYKLNSKTGKINFENVAEYAQKYKPKMIICGFTSYPFIVEFSKFAKIAKKTKALLLADISHIAALIISGKHPSPFGFADVVMTTTHKSLRGPRGALIFAKNEQLGKKIDRSIFPHLQGGPHMHTIAAIGIALNEAKKDSFLNYGAKIAENAQYFSEELTNLKITHSGTENHLILINTVKSYSINGSEAATKLEKIGILTNKNSLPGDMSAISPSGIRIGTPAITTRGMGQEQIKEIVKIIDDCLKDRNISVNLQKAKVQALAKHFPIR